MKYQIRHKRLAAAYRKIERSKGRIYKEKVEKCPSGFNYLRSRNLTMDFLDKSDVGNFIGSAYSMHERVMVDKVVTEGTCFPKKLSEDFVDLKLRKKTKELPCDDFGPTISNG